MLICDDAHSDLRRKMVEVDDQIVSSCFWLIWFSQTCFRLFQFVKKVVFVFCFLVDFMLFFKMNGSLDRLGCYVSLYAVLGCVRSF